MAKKDDGEWKWEEHSMQLKVRMSPELMEFIDNWRRDQPDIPSRTEAIRRIVQSASKKDRHR
jgi:hypothetical protein